MRWILILVFATSLASCSQSRGKPTWDDVYRLIDSKALQSRIDRAINEAEPQTHPASVCVTEYFTQFIAGKPDLAWKCVRSGSRFETLLGSVEKLSKTIQEAKKDNDYISIAIKGISIHPLNSENIRTAKVLFVLKVYDKLANKEYESEGKYHLSELDGKWLIDNTAELRDVPK